jgi:RHS repeat-associated protein
MQSGASAIGHLNIQTYEQNRTKLWVDPNGASRLLRSYLWGLDLSGSIQGAGGIGGLLVSQISNSQITNCFVVFDGNGNVAALLNAADGSTSAQYEYGPFGEVMRATGPMAKANPFRFSTKYQDDESDLLYYGYRYFNAGTGRWLGRDLIGEAGMVNIYGFCANNPLSFADRNGLDFATWSGAGPGYSNWNPPDQNAWQNPDQLGFFDTAYRWFFDGSDVNVPFSNYDPGWGPSQFADFSKDVSSVCAKCGTSQHVSEARTRDLYNEGLGSILYKGAPGRYNLVLDGTLESYKAECECKWKFSGKVYAPSDRINFDANNAGRTGLGQFITEIVSFMQQHTGIGRDFNLNFKGERPVVAQGTCPKN